MDFAIALGIVVLLLTILIFVDRGFNKRKRIAKVVATSVGFPVYARTLVHVDGSERNLVALSTTEIGEGPVFYEHEWNESGGPLNANTYTDGVVFEDAADAGCVVLQSGKTFHYLRPYPIDKVANIKWKDKEPETCI
jgi:hypothetical protein